MEVKSISAGAFAARAAAGATTMNCDRDDESTLCPSELSSINDDGSEPEDADSITEEYVAALTFWRCEDLPLLRSPIERAKSFAAWF